MRDVLPIGPSEFVRPFCGPILTGFPAYERDPASGEIWGDMGRYGEIFGEIWGDLPHLEAPRP